MNLFATDMVKSLKQKSEDAVGVFKRTVADLADVNNQIIGEENKRLTQMEDIQKELDNLNEVKKDNQKFIDKINDFLGVDPHGV